MFIKNSEDEIKSTAMYEVKSKNNFWEYLPKNTGFLDS